MVSAAKKTKQRTGAGGGGRYTLFQTQELEKAIIKKMPFKLKLSNQSLAKI